MPADALWQRLLSREKKSKGLQSPAGIFAESDESLSAPSSSQSPLFVPDSPQSPLFDPESPVSLLVVPGSPQSPYFLPGSPTPSPISPIYYEVEAPIPEASAELPWWVPLSDEYPWDTHLSIMEDKQTPSSVGDIEAAVPLSVPETAAPLSVRADNDTVAHSHTAVHHAHSQPLLQPSHLAHDDQPSMQTIQPSALTAENVEESPFGSVRLGPNEFAVTLPMDSRVKDDYERVLTNGASSMRSFLESFDPSKQISDHERSHLLSKAQELTCRLNNVSFHPDLNIPQYLNFSELGDSELDSGSSWAEYSSTKFSFLKYWMELASEMDIHVILTVQGDLQQTIVERYLRGKGFTYTRPREELGGNLEVSLIKGSLSFGIHSTDGVRELFRPPSAIFVLDASFDPTSPSVQHIRTTYTRNGGLLPVIWLLVANTCEHIGRCLPGLPELERMQLLLHETAGLHEDVGDLQDDALGVSEAAEEIRNYLSDRFASWPLASIEPLHLLSFDPLESGPSSEEPPGALKRELDDEAVGFSSKRPRLDVQGPNDASDSGFASFDRKLIQERLHDSEKAQLQNDLLKAQSRAREIEKALSELQHRYESRTKDLHKTRQERDRLLEDRTSLEQRIEKLREDVSKLKDDRSNLRHELEAARQELKNNGGTLADLEAAREEIRRLQKENASLERRSEYSQSQSEYTREQYQTASTVAAQAGTEARQLREENEILLRRVAANTAQLYEINKKNDAARHLDRIEELEMILAARNDLLRKKEEELREIRKNRPSTRSTSTQPRSPKWAASSRPTSPGLNHNGNGNGLAGRGSALRFSSEMPF